MKREWKLENGVGGKGGGGGEKGTRVRQNGRHTILYIKIIILEVTHRKEKNNIKSRCRHKGARRTNVPCHHVRLEVS